MEQEPERELPWTTLQRIGASLRLAGHLAFILVAILMAIVFFVLLTARS